MQFNVMPRMEGSRAKPLVKGSRRSPPEAERILIFAKQNFSIHVKLYNVLEPGSMTMKHEENSAILTSDYATCINDGSAFTMLNDFSFIF